MANTGFVYDKIYLEHRTAQGHPERPVRLRKIIERLENVGIRDKLVNIKPTPATVEQIETVHSPDMIERVQRACAAGEQYIETMDVSICTRTYEVALTAAGGVLRAIDEVMQDNVRNAFCAVRPPGHHSTRSRPMGFCIFNNVAIAGKYLQQKYGLKKLLIADWDVHHGNGTQEAFYEDPSVLYFSTHQYPFYPGTGGSAEKGEGPGKGFTINVPLPVFSEDDKYIEVYKTVLKPAAVDFDPDFLLISAGFDAHKDDLLGSMKLTVNGFEKLTEIVKSLAADCCQGRIVSVLEGGYHLQGLAASVEAHVRVLMQ